MPIIVDKEKKKIEIIEAAMAVFSRIGYQKAKMKDIADEAGIGKGTIYEYFRSKQDLFLQIFAHVSVRLLENWRSTLDSIAVPEEQIRVLLSSTIRQAAEWTDLMYLMVDVMSAMDRKGEEDRLRLMMADSYDRAAKTLAEYIRMGQAKGVFKEMNPTLVALVIMALLDGIFSQFVLNREMYRIEDMTDTLTRILFDGLKRQK